MKLSICMMVKNEEKNLIRCLDSLKPLMANVKSELIIVDTGSTDNTVNNARSYSDKVYFHPWNNDFSEMRNITISYAKGEWILIIDADEELDDSDEITMFFKQPKLMRKYNTCLLKVANFTNPSITINESVTYFSPRLFRNDGFFHYEGKVHNQAKWRGNVLSLNSALWHYGYDHNDEELMQRKFERTSQLLKEELIKNPDNIYYRYQLSVSYGMHNNFEEALVEIRKAYTVLIEKQDFKNSVYVYGTYAKYAFESKKFEETEKICLEGIKLEPDYLDLYFILAHLYKLQGRSKSAVQAYEKYLNLLEKLPSLDISRNTAIKLQTMDKEIYALLDLCSLQFELGNYTTTLQIGAKLHNKIHHVSSDVVSQLFEIYIKAALKLQDYSKIDELYSKVLETDYRKYYQSILEKQILNIPENEQYKITALFATGDDLYSRLNQLRFNFIMKNFDGFQISLTSLASEVDFNTEPEFYSQLISYFIYFKKPFSNILNDVSKENIDRIFEYYFKTYPLENKLIQGYVENASIIDDLKSLRIQRFFIKNTLLFMDIDNEIYTKIFKKYIHFGVLYVSLLYSENIIKSHEWSDLNSEDKFLLEVNEANRLVLEGNYHQAIKCLKNTLITNSQFSKGVKAIAEEIGIFAKTPVDELEMYARQVKLNIETLINKEELGDASCLIGELEQIMDTDAEILSMKAIILLKREKTSEAEKLLEQAIAHYPDDFDLVYNLASIYEMRGKYKEAQHCYRQASHLCQDQNLILRIENHLKNLVASLRK